MGIQKKIMKSNKIPLFGSVLLVLLLSGCTEIPPDQYCGCPEYEYLGTIKDFNINIQKGIFTSYEYCQVILNDDKKIFIEGAVCEGAHTGINLYKSLNRNTFYTMCDPKINYTIKDKCEYEINDVSKGILHLKVEAL
jgi:hypothetical protein